MKYRLKEGHSTHEKFSLLMRTAMGLGLHLQFEGGKCTLTDLENGNSYKVEDIETPSYPIVEFPSATEVHLTFED